MGTPLDAAAGIAGLISLAFTVFQGCVQGFVILSTARQIGRDGDFLRVMIEWEHYRLYEWSQHAGIANERVTTDLNWALILGLLQQLEVLLTDVTKLRDRYGLVFEDKSQEKGEEFVAADAANESSLRNLSLQLDSRFFLSSTKAIHEKNRGSPLRRLRWSVIDKTKLEVLLHDVRQVLTCLWDALTFGDRKYVRDVLDLLLRNAIATSKNETEIAQFSMLAKSDGTNLSIAGQIKQSRLDLGEIANVPPSEAKTRTRSQRLKKLRLKSGLLDQESGSTGQEREITRYDGEFVLAEFKWLDPDRSLKEKLTFRIENIAMLLNEAKDESLHTLRCRGIVKKSDQIISIFNLPQLSKYRDPTSYHPVCLSLMDLIKGKWTPDLTTRLTWAFHLADTILQLHTAGWMHKEIRPEHIIFIKDGPVEDMESSGLAGPFLSYFNYARESSLAAYSEKRVSERRANVYRHIDVQGEAKASFRPRYDVYAMGLCLIEISTWAKLPGLISCDSDTLPFKLVEADTLTALRSKLAVSLHRKFVDAVMMALTFSESPVAVASKPLVLTPEDPVTVPNIEDRAGKDSDEEEISADDTVDIQQEIVSLLRQCL